MGRKKKRKTSAAPFSTIGCMKCGDRRVLEQPCSTCGAPPRVNEVNHEIVKRRERIAIVDRVSLPASGTRPSLTIDNYSETLISAANKLTEGFALLLDSNSSVEELKAFGSFIRWLENYVLQLAELSTKRPNALPRAIHSTARSLLEAWEEVHIATTTSNMGEVQRAQERSQRIIDNAPNALQEATRAIARAELLNDSSKGSLSKRVISVLAELHGTNSFKELQTAGANLGKEVLGYDIAPDASFSLSVLAVIAQANFDWQAVQEKIRAASRPCSNSERLAEIANMGGALERLVRTDRLIYEALDAYTKVIEGVDDIEMATRRLAKTAAEVFEEAQPLLTWYRLLTSTSTGNDRFEKWSERNSTDHARELTKHSDGKAVFSAFRPYLRNAPSHSGGISVDPVTGDISINLHSHKSLIPSANFTDEVLALLESFLAAKWALENSLLSIGIEFSPSERDLRFLGFDQLDVIATFVELEQGTSVSTEDSSQDHWVLSLDCEFESALASAHTVVHLSPPEVKSVTVGKLESGVIDIPSQVLHAALETTPNDDQLEHLLRMGELVAQCRRQEESFLSPERGDHLIRALVLLDDSPDILRFSRLRRFLNLARKVGLREQASKAQTAMRLLRLGKDTQLGRMALDWDAGEKLALPSEGAVRVIGVSQHKKL